MYQRLGLDYEERVLPSIVNEVLKSVVAKFNASQLITQRAQVCFLALSAWQQHVSPWSRGLGSKRAFYRRRRVWGWSCSSAGECLPSIHTRALGLILSII